MSDYPDIIHGAQPGQLIHRPTLFPLATYVILGLNFFVFLLMTFVDATSHPPLRDLITRTFSGFNADPEFILRFGASFGPYTRRGEYWRLVMPMFIHIGLLHLAINNYSLYILGRLLEPIYGYGRFAFLYVATGIGSAYLSMSMTHNVSAGASGAIFGIAGVMLVAGYLHRGSIPRQWGRAFGKGILPIIVLNLALGGALHQWVDNWAHLGGLVSGVLLALIIAPPKREYVPGQPMEEPSQAMAAIPVIVVVVAMVATAVNYRTNTVLTRLLREGEVFHALKRDDWAMQRFQAAATRAPRDERPHQMLGALYLGEKKWADAIREFELADRLGSMTLAPQLGLAQAYMELGNSAKAQDYLDAIEKDFPQTAQAQYEVAALYSQYKFYALAISHFNTALRLDPGMAEAQNDLAWLYATCDDPKFRDPKAAIEHARRAVELTHWTQPNIIDTLAESLYANQNYAEAVNVQTKALALQPHNRVFAEHMARYMAGAKTQAEK
ncbi:MAG TPA: rhomboid family intramembrane serine protease [Terriglobia bacterium]|nr:rhomboid family intramembrane serine protease [Terriglobia bacterium]